MQEMKFLNSKEKRDIVRSLENQYGFTGELHGNLLLNAKEKLYLLADSEIISREQDKQLRIDRAGLHIASIAVNGLRLSVEGSQLLGPRMTKNILEIAPEHLEPWVKGQDFELYDREREQTQGRIGIYCLKLGRDFIGSTIVKDNKVQNCLSKNRWVKNLNI
jgi:NOL1/NOP2/fmu family ribosome biogenesis protein